MINRLHLTERHLAVSQMVTGNLKVVTGSLTERKQPTVVFMHDCQLGADCIVSGIRSRPNTHYSEYNIAFIRYKCKKTAV